MKKNRWLDPAASGLFPSTIRNGKFYWGAVLWSKWIPEITYGEFGAIALRSMCENYTRRRCGVGSSCRVTRASEYLWPDQSEVALRTHCASEHVRDFMRPPEFASPKEAAELLSKIPISMPGIIAVGDFGGRLDALKKRLNEG